MNQTNNRRKIFSAVRWILWVIIIQFLLFNISGACYGYKLTYFYEPGMGRAPGSSRNIVTRTWKLFTGPRFEKSVVDEYPHFPYQTIHLYTKNKLSIESWYMPVDSARGTVVLVHGLGQNKSMLLNQAYEFRYLGFNVMLIDLRAHGNSGGNVSTLGFLESEELKLAYEFVARKGERNIVFYGVSLGATVIAKSIYDYGLSPSRVILEIPFDSAEKLLARRMRMLGFPDEPFGAVTTFWASVERGFNGFDLLTSRYARKITCPVLLQYGAHDKIVSASETNSVFDNIASRQKKLVRFDTADHEFLLNRDIDKWRTEIAAFLVP